MTYRTRTALAVMAAALAVPVAPALADGGGTSWPGSALLAGRWSGTAASTEVAGFTFPVSAEVRVAATGRPTGTVVLGAPVNCAGAWVPVSTRGRVTTFSERVRPTGDGECIDDGTVRLSPASRGRLRYVWTKGDAGSVAYLSPTGVSGAWTGTLRQAGDPPVPVSLRITGVRAGQMEGRSRYGAPFSCTGRLVPRGAGTQSSATFTEVITRSGSDRCVGIGTMRVRLRSDGRLAYRWTGGGVTSTALLTRAR
jgi:hypothetical protein